MEKFCKGKIGGRGGFALIVALSLMSFMLLIALSMATLTRTELASNSQMLAEAKARENARLGLLIALGHLQGAAGEDRRVTARANILGLAEIPNEFWTGVWDANSGSMVTWLVSGNANLQDPIQFSPELALAKSVTVFGDAASGSEVRAPLLDISDDGLERYAYCILDEGVKARINLRDYAWGSNDDAQERRSRESSRRPGVEEIDAWNSMRSLRGNVEWGKRLELLMSQDQAELLRSDTLEGETENSPVLHDLDTTVVSRMLPVSVKSGGFRKDLSRILDEDYNAAPYQNSASIIADASQPLVTWGVLRSFANPWDDWGEAEEPMPLVEPKAPSVTQAGLFPLPVLVQIGWGAIRSGTGEGALLQITMKPVVALANPYDVSLAAADYQVQVAPETGRGYMMISFEPEPAYGSVEFEEGVNTRGTEFHPQDLLGEPPTFTIRGASFEPGEVKLFGLAETGEYPESGNDGAVLSEAYPSSNYVWKNTRRELGSFTRGPEGRVTMQISGGRYSLQYRLGGGGAWQSLQDIEQIGIGISPSNNQLDDAGQPKVQVSLEPDVAGGAPPSINLIRRRFSMRTSETDYVSDSYRGTGLRWLADFNPRASTVNSRPPGWISHPLWLTDAGNTNNHLPLNSDWIIDYQLDISGDARGFWGDSTNALGESVVTLFSVPRQRITSLGFLQHAPFSERVWDPTYSFGNSYASPFVASSDVDLSYELNEFFWDDFFFSSLVREADGEEWIAENPRVKLLSDAKSSLLEAPAIAAAGLLIEGGFNVNSTSLEAWKAMLSNFAGLRMRYYNTESGLMSEVTLDNSYFRSLSPNGDADKPWSGYHALTSEQIEILAAQIVERIRNRGRPFTSLAEFINRPLGEDIGLLQAAIDSDTAVELDGKSYGLSTINSKLKTPMVTTYDDSGAQNAQAGLGARSTAAPGWLTQADVLTAIGPYLAVRSDTFIIRAYGDSVNPFTDGVEAEAICEAIVQRFPEAVTPVSDDADEVGFYEPVDGMGRKFKVIGFRWLNEREI
ncbi:hypothetical protein [Cerasicoccus maritimus]|uniref:hypothetical protein n=1 Tax=Cerasicoccus maritimus TaxID=490089 RepID=UPI002852A92D|nr:hypothetical protein [Cerasicoccus maritimus]